MSFRSSVFSYKSENLHQNSRPQRLTNTSKSSNRISEILADDYFYNVNDQLSYDVLPNQTPLGSLACGQQKYARFSDRFGVVDSVSLAQSNHLPINSSIMANYHETPEYVKQLIRELEREEKEQRRKNRIRYCRNFLLTIIQFVFIFILISLGLFLLLLFCLTK